MKLQIKIPLILLSFSLLIAAGCTSVAPLTAEDDLKSAGKNPQISEIEPSQTKIKKRPKPSDYPVAPFKHDSLYQLLVAEVAGYRRDYDTALKKYLEMAEVTRDAGVAARATRLANYLKRNDLALRAAQIWSEAEPDSIEAHRHAADQLMHVGDLEAAIYHMEAVRNLGGLANFDVFAYRAASLDDEGRKSLLVAISNLLERHPGDEQLMFSKAVLLEQNGNFEETLVITNELLSNKPLAKNENTQVITLKANVLKSLHRPDDAIRFLKHVVAGTEKGNRRLRLTLARFLFESDRLDEAREQYAIIHRIDPNDADILFALALIAMEQDQDDTATEYLHQMIRWNRRTGEAHFYLGSIAEKRSNVPEALKEYRQVGRGYEFLPAMSRIASLMIEQGRIGDMHNYFANMRSDNPERADQLVMIEAQFLSERGLKEDVFALLDGVLGEASEKTDLLYFRAMTAQKFDRLDVMETDLQQVIQLDPDNSDAMNALGYTLADQTLRFDEALDLIERALDIKPDEAAFIDSMGWVLYRLNRFEEAIVYLRRALKLFINDEVAAHLGEVLWMAGEQVEAAEIWQKALEITPDSEILKKVIERFTPS